MASKFVLPVLLGYYFSHIPIPQLKLKPRNRTLRRGLHLLRTQGMVGWIIPLDDSSSFDQLKISGIVEILVS